MDYGTYRSIFNGAQYVTPVKFIGKKSKCAGLGHEIGFLSCRSPWLVKGATQLCTSQKECNKLHMSVAEYF